MKSANHATWGPWRKKRMEEFLVCACPNPSHTPSFEEGDVQGEREFLEFGAGVERVGCVSAAWTKKKKKKKKNGGDAR